jgi:predicted MFS family arabinose efflux permease
MRAQPQESMNVVEVLVVGLLNLMNQYAEAYKAKAALGLTLYSNTYVLTVGWILIVR